MSSNINSYDNFSKNVNEIKKMFLKESYIENWKVYQRTLSDFNMNIWDYIVLTASNKEQAKIYQEEIDYRVKNNILPKLTKYRVIEDPDGKRVGSGGATLNVIKSIFEEHERLENTFEDKKILVIHSGGDSKRIPQYSTCGKLFSPVPRELPDGRTSTLFDEFIISLSGIPQRMKNGMLIMSGDVLLLFNPMQVDLQYIDVAGLSMKVETNLGINHGVYLSDENRNIKKFLHKETRETLCKNGAINKDDYVDLDTGAVYLSDKVIVGMLNLISTDKKIDKIKFDKFVSDKTRLNLYGDFLYPFAIDSTLENYLLEKPEFEINDLLIECRKNIWNELRKYTMSIVSLSPAEFIHFGTTKELLNLLTNDINEYKYLGWDNKVITNIDNINYAINSSYIDSESEIGKNVYIENSYIGKNVFIGNNSIVSCTKLNDIKIPENICLHTLKQKNNEYITRIYSIDENPKKLLLRENTFLNKNVKKMLKIYNLNSKIFGDEDTTIWDAKLYVPGNTIQKSVKNAIKLYDIFNCTAKQEDVKKWADLSRTSLKESFNMASGNYIRKIKFDNEILIKRDLFIKSIKMKENLIDSISIIINSQNINTQIDSILNIINQYDFSIKIRIYLAISKILKSLNIKHNDQTYDYFEDLCYNEINNIIPTADIKLAKRNKIMIDYKCVEYPIRINFAGGWSDTPPYCIENGGTVLNASFLLNDEKPIKVYVKRINEPKIILESIDLKVKKEFDNLQELFDYSNPYDLFAIHKSALIISNIISKNKTFNQIITELGGGIHFITDVEKIPKGSGLGTSSILAAACVKALFEIRNIEITDYELADLVLKQEQLMSTGGGWQDQIGGIFQGFKYIKTLPSKNQKFNIEKLELNENVINEINNKSMLIYTGQRRLAKNLLRNIVEKCISYDKITLDIIYKMQVISTLMKFELEKGNIIEFSKLLNQHWDLSKSLDEGYTNGCIEQIINSCEDLIESKFIPGAGGGGFIFVILKDNVKKSDLEKRIKDIFQDSGIETWNIKLC